MSGPTGDGTLVGWTMEGRAWLASLPPAARDVATEFPPWHVYRIRGTATFVTIVQYNVRDGQCRSVDGMGTNALRESNGLPALRYADIPVEDLQPIHRTRFDAL